MSANNVSQEIKTLDELVNIVQNLKSKGKTVVHCHGVFDLLHIGHIKHLRAAKEMGDILVVTLTPDKFVNKGPHRPAFTESLRAEAIAALDCVDYVAINKWPTAVETIQLLKPNFFVKGIVHGEDKRDHSDAINQEEEAIKAVGGNIIFTDEETYSASTLINRFMDIFPPMVKAFLESFREKYTSKEIIGYLQAIRPLKLLAIGEVIIDEYRFCTPLGKASKEAVLVVRSLYNETYAGGILAIANHISNFCDQVGLLSFIGGIDSYEEFIAEKLYKNVKTDFIRIPNIRTIVKCRFVEEYSVSKLFEIYIMENRQLTSEYEDSFLEKLEEKLPDYDVVVVADYGHGLFSERSIRLLCDKARFLAINTQTNAGNLGFNTISKYSRADYISIAEPELRLECRDTNSDTKELMLKIANKLSCDKMIITRGKYGTLSYDKKRGFFEIPVFSVRLVDRIGAGDALLSLTAPLAAMNVPMDIVGFIGNVVGAEACAIIGNKTFIEPSNLFRHIDSLMK
jgi:rfaE bifunctional protein nucleotidyltransferase chain/domain